MSAKVEIALSKKKSALLVLGALLFVVIGGWMLSLDAQTIESQQRFNSPTFVYSLAVVCIVLFGLLAAVGIVKLLDKAPGLIINNEGIIDNSSAVSAGFIPWEDVVEIGYYQMQKQNFVSIHVRNPEVYCNRGNPLVRMLKRANFKMSGTPISITANTLAIDFKQLLEILQSNHFKVSAKL